ncbi:hypothetical protein AB0F18_01625 [Streptomyces sp. NPDC029216]|uniref:hypothetical protein n=1 Tax=Streptomyces sp. NPDC029216 TaxID=3154701 RepID=UPI0033CBDC4C
MELDLRRAAVTALGELARSEDWRDRADAGHGLAGFAEMPEALGPLRELVLDRGDTFVTRHTAQALLRRRDRAGLSAVAAALAVADPNHGDWIDTAVADVFGFPFAELDEALRLCEELTRDTDDGTALGARRLYEALAEIGPDPLPPLSRP